MKFVFIIIALFVAVLLLRKHQQSNKRMVNIKGVKEDWGRTQPHEPVDETLFTKIPTIETDLTDVNRSVDRKEYVQKLQPNDLLELDFKYSLERSGISKAKVKNPDMIEVKTGVLDIGNISKKLQSELSTQMDEHYILQPKVKSVVCKDHKYSVTILIERWKPNEPYKDEVHRLKFSMSAKPYVIISSE